MANQKFFCADWTSVRADLERVATIATASHEGVSAKISCLGHQTAFVGRDSGLLFDALIAGHVAAHGSSPAVNAKPNVKEFIGDDVDMASSGVETLIYGPGDWHYAADEYVEIEEMVAAARTYLATAYRLMGVA